MGRIVADEADNLINTFDRRDQNLRWSEYKGSVKWYRLKDLALARARNHCEWIKNPESIPISHKISIKMNRCKSRYRLEMHHVCYPNNPEEDCLDDVEILYHKHHQEVGGFAMDDISLEDIRTYRGVCE